MAHLSLPPSPSHIFLLSLPASLSLSPLDLPEPHIASNDSDSELEEAPELPSPAGGGALHRLSFLEKQGSEASAESSRDSRSGSEEQLGAVTGEDGDGLWESLGEDPARRLSEYNTNQCNNVAPVRLPAMRLRAGRLPTGSGWERQPEFV